MIDMACKFMGYPVISSIFYVSVCYALGMYKTQLNKLYKNNETYKHVIKIVGIIHNLIMTVFSGAFFIKLCHLVLAEYGSVINHKVWLENHIITNQDILNLCWVFCHSKIVEYIDTFLILLKGGSPIFLQKYHHFGAVWAWFILLYADSTAVLIPCILNSFVHTVMYSYYLLSIFDKKNLKSIKMFITLLQIVQLKYGLIISVFDYTLYHYSKMNSLNRYILSGLFFQSYTFILILLFLDFSYKQYVRKDTKLN